MGKIPVGGRQCIGCCRRAKRLLGARLICSRAEIALDARQSLDHGNFTVVAIEPAIEPMLWSVAAVGQSVQVSPVPQLQMQVTRHHLCMYVCMHACM